MFKEGDRVRIKKDKWNIEPSHYGIYVDYICSLPNVCTIKRVFKGSFDVMLKECSNNYYYHIYDIEHAQEGKAVTMFFEV